MVAGEGGRRSRELVTRWRKGNLGRSAGHSKRWGTQGGGAYLEAVEVGGTISGSLPSTIPCCCFSVRATLEGWYWRALGLARGWLEGAGGRGLAAGAGAGAGAPGLEKLFCLVTLALAAEQSRGVWGGIDESKEVVAYSSSNSLVVVL